MLISGSSPGTMGFPACRRGGWSIKTPWPGADRDGLEGRMLDLKPILSLKANPRARVIITLVFRRELSKRSRYRTMQLPPRPARFPGADTETPWSSATVQLGLRMCGRCCSRANCRGYCRPTSSRAAASPFEESFIFYRGTRRRTALGGLERGG